MKVSSIISALVLCMANSLMRVHLPHRAVNTYCTTIKLVTVDQPVAINVTSAGSTSPVTYNSTTMRTLLIMVDSFAAALSEMDRRSHTLRIMLMSKVERDVRITLGAGRYLLRRATKDTRFLLSSARDPLKYLPGGTVDNTESQPQLLSSFTQLSTAERVQEQRALKAIASRVVDAAPFNVYRTLTVLPSTLQYDYQRRRRSASDLLGTSAAKYVLPSSFNFNLIPPCIASTVPLQLALDQSARTYRKYTLSNDISWSLDDGTGVETQVRFDKVREPANCHLRNSYKSLARSTRNADYDTSTAYNIDTGSLSYTSAKKNTVIDITAETSDTWEALLIGSILVSLDIVLFLIETVLMATIPVVRDGGGQVLTRIAETFYLEDQASDLGKSLIFVPKVGSSNATMWCEYTHFN